MGAISKVVISQIFKLGVIKKILGSTPVKSPTLESSKVVLIQPRSIAGELPLCHALSMLPCLSRQRALTEFSRLGKSAKLGWKNPRTWIWALKNGEIICKWGDSELSTAMFDYSFLPEVFKLLIGLQGRKFTSLLDQTRVHPKRNQTSRTAKKLPYIIVTRCYFHDLSWHRSIVTRCDQQHDPTGSNWCLRVNLFQRDEAGLLCIEFAPEPDGEKDVAVGHAEEFLSDMESRVMSTRNHHCFHGKTAH